MFSKLRRDEGVANVVERMIVVGKGYVDRLRRPIELQGQEGFLFYSRDDQNDVAAITPFFNRGKGDTRFLDRRDDLAIFMEKQIGLINAGTPAPTAQTTPIVAANGRTVFLAKPASDVKQAYARIVTELTGKGFTVAPDPDKDVPDDAGAKPFLAEAMANAEALIHLVGESGGFAPEGLDPIVKLQLALARDQAAQIEGAPGERIKRRIVWAPKVLDEGGATPAGPMVERDPLQALEKFDQQIATDKIDGDILSKFVEYLFQYLTETAPKPAANTAAGNKLESISRIRLADEDYAGAIAASVARLLRQTAHSGRRFRRRFAPLQWRPARQMRRGDALLGERLGGLGALGSRPPLGLADARQKGTVRVPRPDRGAAASSAQEDKHALAHLPGRRVRPGRKSRRQGPPTPELLSGLISSPSAKP